MSTSSSISKSRVLKGSAYLSAGPIVALFLGLIISSLIGLYIDPIDLGEYSFINELISIITAIAIFGLPGALTKFLSEYIGKNDQARVDSLLKTHTILVVIITIGMLLISYIAVPIYFKVLGFQLTDGKLILIILTISVMIVSRFGKSIISGYYEVETLGIFDLISSVISRLMVIVAIIVTIDAYSLILRYIVTEIIFIIMFVGIQRKIYTFKGDRHPIKPLVSYGIPNTSAFIIGLIFQNLSLKGLLLLYFGQVEVGYFDYAFRLAMFINTMTLGLFTALFGYYSRLYGEGG
ncbi:MAG: oligosaccharide flippase family protein, partial [Candidatus Hodarchaeales archaeon]